MVAPDTLVPLDPDDLFDQIHLAFEVRPVAGNLDLDDVRRSPMGHAKGVEHGCGIRRTDGVAEKRGRAGSAHRDVAALRRAARLRGAGDTRAPVHPAISAAPRRAPRSTPSGSVPRSKR